MSAKNNPVSRILRLLKLEKAEISGIYFHAILNGLIQLSLPVGVQAIIGFVLGGAMSTSLVVLITLVVLGVLFSGMLQIGQMQLIEKVQQKIFVRYSLNLADRIPKIDLKAADDYYLPELMNRFFEVPTLQKSLAKLLLDIPTATIQILFGLILLSFYHPAFILFGSMLVLTLWLILYYSGNRGLSTSLDESMYKYKVASWLEEMARLVKTFKFSKGSSLNLEKADEFTTSYLIARNQHFNILQFQYKILVGFKVLITASMLIVGSVLLVNQQLNIGQFIAAEIVIITVINSVEKLIGNLDSVYDVLTSVEKIGKIADQPIEADGNMEFPTQQQGIAVQMQQVSFGYTDNTIELSGLSMSITPGQKVCISGGESKGKSTILKLLTGAYTNYTGSIMINGLPIGNYNLDSMRSKIGIMLDQQGVFNGTIWENISMGNPHIHHEQVILLFEMTGLQDYLAAQKKGLNTVLSTAGNRLSERVLRKILLIRALAGNPKMLLLEEPWLGLEEHQKRSIQQYLLNALPDTTVLVVSNDKEFASKCDQVIEIV
jgi:ABC-type bacteriocin/lantibiotic exporter with double-glycine peptidase domain